jgi:hypothetical protein
MPESEYPVTGIVDRGARRRPGCRGAGDAAGGTAHRARPGLLDRLHDTQNGGALRPEIRGAAAPGPARLGRAAGALQGRIPDAPPRWTRRADPVARVRLARCGRRALRISGTNTDLAERKRAEQRIHELAYFDRLTGLPNRHCLAGELDKVLARSERSGQVGALLFARPRQFQAAQRYHGPRRWRPAAAPGGAALEDGLAPRRPAGAPRRRRVRHRVRRPGRGAGGCHRRGQARDRQDPCAPRPAVSPILPPVRLQDQHRRRAVRRDGNRRRHAAQAGRSGDVPRQVGGPTHPRFSIPACRRRRIAGRRPGRACATARHATSSSCSASRNSISGGA